MNIKDIDELFEYSIVMSYNAKQLKFFKYLVKEILDKSVKFHFDAFIPQSAEQFLNNCYDLQSEAFNFVYENNSIEEYYKSMSALKLFKQFVEEYKLQDSFFVKLNCDSKYFNSLHQHAFSIKQLKEFKTCCLKITRLMAVYYAKLNNWPYMLLFEDDAVPTANARSQIETVIDNMKRYQTEHKEEIDIFLLGVQSLIPDHLEFFYDRTVTKCNPNYYVGNNAFLISKNAYEKFIQTNIYMNAVQSEILVSHYIANMLDAKAIFYDAKNGSAFKQVNLKQIDGDRTHQLFKYNENDKSLNHAIIDKCLKTFI